MQGPNVSDLIRTIASRLRAARTDADRDETPDLDARLLVGHALGLDATGLVLHANRAFSEADVARASALAERRIAGEPVARIVGEKEFWSLSLRLSPETLVPRPDTETVVAAALDFIDSGGRRGEALRVLDLGTGTGAILLALLSELPAATGVGVDLAVGAARTARDTAERLGLGERAGFAVTDWTAGIDGRFDLVVSNPPYIKSGEISGLAVEVSRFDPDMALDGGPDGLAAFRAVVDRLGAVLAGTGAAFIEIGAGQADSVTEMAVSLGFEARRHKDLGGIDRVLELRRGKIARQKMSLEIRGEPARFRAP